LLLFAGEPGIGKSRLLAEATEWASAHGWRVVAGGCTRRSGQAPYEPMVSALAQEVRRTPAARLRLELQGCGWLVRLLPELLETQVVPAPTWTLPPDQERRLMFDAVARYLANVAGPAGTLLILDDLQWADGDALAALETLVRGAAEAGQSAPLRLLGAYRSTEVRPQDPLGLLLADLIGASTVARRQLPLLAPVEAAALLAHLWPARREGEESGAEAEARAETLRRAGGLPFFLVSSASALQERTGRVHPARHADGAHGAHGADGREGELAAYDSVSGQVPASVAESVQARVAVLPETARRLAEVAAVAGRIISAPLVMAVSARPEEETLDALDALVNVGLLAEDGKQTYRFTHDLIREIVEGGLGSQRRRTLHRRLAEELERRPTGAQQIYAAEIATHYLAAGEQAQALPHMLLAGDQAEAVYAHAEAEGYYRTALELAQDLGEQARATEALGQLGQVMQVQGRYRDAVELLDSALRGYETLGDQDGVLRVLASLLVAQSLFGLEMAEAAEARAQAILARVETQAAQDASISTAARASLLAAVYRNLSLVYKGSGRYEEELTAARHAVDLARAAGDEAQLAWALHRLYASGALTGDRIVLDDILAMAERTGQTMLLDYAYDHMADEHEYAGEFAQMMAAQEKALAIAEQRQDPVRLTGTLSNMSERYYYLGDWTRARVADARFASIMREVDPRGVTWRSIGIALMPGTLALMEGREDEGRRLLEQTSANAEKVGDAYLLVFAAYPLAECDLLAGHAEQARLRLTSLFHHAAVVGRPARMALPLLAWAEVALGQWDQAEARLATLLAGAEPLIRVDALRVQGLLAMKRGHWAVGVEALEETLERVCAMPYPYAEAKALWVYGRLEAARGTPKAARERFAQALAICDRLGEGLYRPHIERDLRGLAQ
jgi:tetratricopeptide (TPR) repeat protein